MFHVFKVKKHPKPNDDIQEFHHKEIRQDNLVNCKDKLITTHKKTKRVEGVKDKIFHPP